MRTKKFALFQLFEVTTTSEPSVTGRCLSGIIQKDDTILGVSRDEKRMEPIDKLSIIGIEIYQRRVPEIEGGLTARLFLSDFNSGFEKDVVLWIVPPDGYRHVGRADPIAR